MRGSRAWAALSGATFWRCSHDTHAAAWERVFRPSPDASPTHVNVEAKVVVNEELAVLLVAQLEARAHKLILRGGVLGVGGKPAAACCRSVRPQRLALAQPRRHGSPPPNHACATHVAVEVKHGDGQVVQHHAYAVLLLNHLGHPLGLALRERRRCAALPAHVLAQLLRLHARM